MEKKNPSQLCFDTIPEIRQLSAIIFYALKKGECYDLKSFFLFFFLATDKQPILTRGVRRQYLRNHMFNSWYWCIDGNDSRDLNILTHFKKGRRFSFWRVCIILYMVTNYSKTTQVIHAIIIIIFIKEGTLELVSFKYNQNWLNFFLFF